MNRAGSGYGILGDLHSIGGPQDYLNVSRIGKKWVTAALYLCSAQVAIGLSLFLLDSFMVYDLTAKLFGQLVAVAMVAIGAAGAFGSHKRSRNLLNLHIVGVIIAILLGVQYITAFSRENYVNCTMARLYMKTRKIQEYLEKQPAVNMFTTVVSRLNEMEDMLNMVEEGSVESLQKKIDAEKMMNSDNNYIRYKLQLLKVHAERLLNNHINATDENTKGMSPEDRRVLNERIDAAEGVLDRIAQHNEDGDYISYEEYEELLHNLADAYEGVGSLQQRTLHDHIKQLSFDKDVFERQGKGYHGSMAKQRQREHHERQIEWSKRMEEAIRKHEFSGAHPDLSDLPQW
eukprot:CAMPEP_0177610332 /NCGR_PEP_ID=MMETSP0419_2-20121207/19705_1 /TAXON_ID=582737 /ORGANISM="Tetraselmis sp., Strain GSL018" /LENGTH=344 /DNA_ID=CAMNT_0019105595 /DNA_START=229 /DNA_END=1260 /DNA_ORIENTATION=+